MKRPSSASKQTRTKHRLFAISLLLTCLQAALTEMVLATTDGVSDAVNPAFPPNPPTSSGEDYIYYHYKFAGGAAGGVMCPGLCDEGDITYYLNGLTSEYKEINSNEVLCRIGTESAALFHAHFCTEREGGTDSFHCGPHVRLCSESDADDCPDESPQFGDCYQLSSNTYTGAGWTVLYTHPAYSNIPLCYYYDQKTCDYIMCPNIADGGIKCHSYNWGWSDYYEVQVWLDPGASIPGGGPAFAALAGALGALGVPFGPSGVSVGFQTKCDCDDGSVRATLQSALGSRIAAGFEHALVAKLNGSLWGFGYDGELINNWYVPNRLTNFSAIVGVAAGMFSSFALRNDGTVWKCSSAPAQVGGLSNIVAISSRNAANYALRKDGTVWAWGGEEGLGELGDGTWDTSETPVQVSNLTNIMSISAGGGHCLALSSNGVVWGWGGVAGGTNVPVQLSSGASAIAAGAYHSLILGWDGQVYAFGGNGHGQLGNGTTTDSSTPVLVTSGATAVAAGDYHSMVIKADGSVYAWGDNSSGQLGDGTTTERHSPVAVNNSEGIVALAGGSTFTIGVVAASGTTVPSLRSWGTGVDGELGAGDLEEDDWMRTEPDLLDGAFGL